MSLVIAVIPARFASSRFPGKVLAPVGDGTMLEAVWRRAREARSIDRLLIATDDSRVRDAAETFGAEARMTSPSHATGTDRVAEVVAALDAEGARAGVVLNVQGDEPLLTGASLDRLVEALAADAPGADGAGEPADVATLVEPLDADGVRFGDALFDPNVVKVVRDAAGRALYFSRSPIPYHRGGASRLAADFRPQLAASGGGRAGYWKHQGIYAFRRAAFDRFCALPPGVLETHEGLEQLRALEAGLTIRAIESDFRSIGVDTPEDLERVRKTLLEAHR